MLNKKSVEDLQVNGKKVLVKDGFDVNIDKLEKIGVNGCGEELRAKGFAENKIVNLLAAVSSAENHSACS